MTESNAFFSESAHPLGEAPPLWIDLEADMEPTEVSPGMFYQPAVGQQLAIALIRFEPNTVAPRHSHAEEQAVVVLEGEAEFEVNGEVRILRPNMVLIVPPHVPHSARTGESGCLVLDAFAPPRQGLAEMMQTAMLRRHNRSGDDGPEHTDKTL